MAYFWCLFCAYRHDVINPRHTNIMKNTNAVVEMFEMYSSVEIVEMFETLDLILYKEGVRQELSPDFEFNYVVMFYLLKRVLREIEPHKQPPRCEN